MFFNSKGSFNLAPQIKKQSRKMQGFLAQCRRIKEGVLTLGLLSVLVLAASCQKPALEPNSPVDAVLIGGGIMSATLGSLLSELDPNIRIVVYEKLNEVALESSQAWNNAGTGHAAYSELNYTPQSPEGIVDIKKAIDINAAFEISKQYWSHLVASQKIAEAKTFINTVPHMSFVWGDKNVAFLKARFEALDKHPFFSGMEFSDDHEQIKKWAPLIMEGRDPQQKVAATRAEGGTDVDFGSLTRSLFSSMLKTGKNQVNVAHEVLDIKRNDDKTWQVVVKDLKTNTTKAINTKFVFIGAGGGSLTLLQKSGIEEGNGYGGFPVGGAWLVTNNEDLINRHWAKVYGQAGVGSPPMSVPHLDTRFIDGKKALLFGPFATFSTKFLKNGSWTDLFGSVSASNFIPMTEVGFKNFDLVTYLVEQVLMSEKQRIESLKEYFPSARAEDWRLSLAGQRVQIIKKDPDKGGILQFGTELVGAKDGSIIALLGASPGASTAVKAMLDVLKRTFAEKMASAEWKQKLKEMVPSFGVDLSKDEEQLRLIRERSSRILNLKSGGFLSPDITP